MHASLLPEQLQQIVSELRVGVEIGGEKRRRLHLPAITPHLLEPGIEILALLLEGCEALGPQGGVPSSARVVSSSTSMTNSRYRAVSTARRPHVSFSIVVHVVGTPGGEVVSVEEPESQAAAMNTATRASNASRCLTPLRVNGMPGTGYRVPDGRRQKADGRRRRKARLPCSRWRSGHLGSGAGCRTLAPNGRCPTPGLGSGIWFLDLEPGTWCLVPDSPLEEAAFAGADRLDEELTEHAVGTQVVDPGGQQR